MDATHRYRGGVREDALSSLPLLICEPPTVFPRGDVEF